MLAMNLLDWIAKLSPLQLILVGATLCFVTGIIMYFWYCAKRSLHRVQLTTRMLERGFSAEQIAAVLTAATPRESDETTASDEDADAEVRLIQHLTENSYEADDVQRILTAARATGGLDDKTVQIVQTLAENGTEAEDIERILRGRQTVPTSAVMA